MPSNNPQNFFEGVAKNILDNFNFKYAETDVEKLASVLRIRNYVNLKKYQLEKNGRIQAHSFFNEILKHKDIVCKLIKGNQ